jgi:hypothetical protein
MTLKQPLLLLAAVTLLGACTRQEKSPESAIGYKPVYASDGDNKNIYSTAPAALKNAGKIYAWAHYAFQVDVGEGIHVMDISNPTNPQKVKFIHLKGVSEMSIRNGHLFANNFNDLVVVNISDMNNLVTESRLSNVYKLTDQNYPPYTGIYFECPDKSKGQIVGWTYTQLSHPKCFR